MSTRQNPSFCIALCGNRAPPALYNIPCHHNQCCCVSLSAFLHSLLRRTSVFASTTQSAPAGTCELPHIALNNPGSRRKTRLFNGNSSYRQFRSSADCFFCFFRKTNKETLCHSHSWDRPTSSRERTPGSPSVPSLYSYIVRSLREDFTHHQRRAKRATNSSIPKNFFFLAQNILPDRKAGAAHLSREHGY